MSKRLFFAFIFVLAFFAGGIVYLSDKIEIEPCTPYKNENFEQPYEDSKVINRRLNKASLLQSRLGRAIPKDFGGLWIDRPPARIIVALVKNSDSATTNNKAMLEVLRGLSIDIEQLDIVLVEYSLRELRQTQNAIVRLNQELTPYERRLISVGVNQDCNKVSVGILKDDLDDQLNPASHKVISIIEKRYKDQVYFETFDSPIRAGTGLE